MARHSTDKESPPPPAVTTPPGQWCPLCCLVGLPHPLSALSVSLFCFTGHRTTVHFPVQFSDASAHSPRGQFSLFDTQPIPSQSFTGEQPPQSPTDPLLPLRNLQTVFPPQSVPWPAAEPPRPDSPPHVPDSEWKVSTELQLKCRKQFLELKPTNGLLQGDQARSFFIQSRLPNNELSTIW